MAIGNCTLQDGIEQEGSRHDMRCCSDSMAEDPDEVKVNWRIMASMLLLGEDWPWLVRFQAHDDQVIKTKPPKPRCETVGYPVVMAPPKAVSTSIHEPGSGLRYWPAPSLPSNPHGKPAGRRLAVESASREPVDKLVIMGC